MKSSLRPMLAICVAFVVSGCGKARLDPETITPAPPLVTKQPPTEEEVKAFAARMEKAARDNDRLTFRDCLRINNLLERGTSDLGLPEKDRADLLAVARTGSHAVGDNFLASLDGGGSFKTLRIRTRDGKPSVLFRLIDAAGKVNYHEMVLARHADGEVATEDAYNFAGGETISQSLRRMILLMENGLAKRAAGLTGKDRLFVEHMSQIGEMVRSKRAGNAAAALDAFRRLPAELQHDKLLQLQAVEFASAVGKEDHLKELERFRHHHPNDEALLLLQINYLTLRGDVPKCLEAIKNLDTVVGGDPFLDCMRSTLLLRSGDPAQALTLAKAAITAEPTLEDGYFVAAEASMAQKDYPTTLGFLQQLTAKTSYSIDPQQLKRNPGYAQFCESPQYVELVRWVASLKK